MKRAIPLLVTSLILIALILAACGPAAPAKKLTVACDATWPPFEMVNEQTKELEGFGPDLIKAVAQKAGLEIELVNVGFDSLLAGTAQCQYDMAISSITITEDRKKDMLFSDPYFNAGQQVTVRMDNTSIKSKDDLGGKTAGAQIGTTGSIEIEKMQGATLKTYDDIGLAYQDLMNGQIDAVVADYPIAVEYVLKNKDKLKNVGTMFTDENYGIAICKKNDYLVDKVNAALKALKAEGYLDKFNDKWILKK